MQHMDVAALIRAKKAAVRKLRREEQKQAAYPALALVDWDDHATVIAAAEQMFRVSKARHLVKTLDEMIAHIEDGGAVAQVDYDADGFAALMRARENLEPKEFAQRLRGYYKRHAKTLIRVWLPIEDTRALRGSKRTPWCWIGFKDEDAMLTSKIYVPEEIPWNELAA